jgi:hypothetical protein
LVDDSDYASPGLAFSPSGICAVEKFGDARDAAVECFACGQGHLRLNEVLAMGYEAGIWDAVRGGPPCLVEVEQQVRVAALFAYADVDDGDTCARPTQGWIAEEPCRGFELKRDDDGGRG